MKIERLFLLLAVSFILIIFIMSEIIPSTKTLDGKIEKINHYNQATQIKLENHEEEIIVFSFLPNLKENQTLRIKGHFEEGNVSKIIVDKIIVLG